MSTNRWDYLPAGTWKTIECTPQTVGVIVGRFQTTRLHEGHRSLIETVQQRHKDVLILLGCSSAKLTRRNPLDGDTRREMILADYPNVRVDLLWDQPSDLVWSQNLDQSIRSKYPTHLPILYGNRDSFLTSYKGDFEYRKLPETVVASATELRQEIIGPLTSEDFRKGVIYAARNRWPNVYPTVDIAVVNKGRILLGRKEQDDGKFRFPGGFVDPKDETLLAAAKRELYEETGGNIEAAEFEYLGSVRINDWRYPQTGEDSIMTSLFKARYLWGEAEASEDLDQVAWVSMEFDELDNLLVPQHRVLLPLLFPEAK